MKNKLLLLFVLLISALSVAQSGINYKAVIKHSNGDIVTNQAITIQFQILEDGTTNVYQETHNPTTDTQGLIAISIGEGTVNNGTYSGIDWSSDEYFLNVQVDVGNGLVDLGTSQFGAVPYAKVADEVRNPPADVSEFALSKAFMTTGQMLNNVYSKVNFDDEVFDIGNNYDPLINRFTVSQAGYYNITATVFNSTPSSTSNEFFTLQIRKNGVGISSNEQFVDNGTFRKTVTATSIEYLIPGDYIEIWAKHFFSTSSLNSAGERNSFTIERIR